MKKKRQLLCIICLCLLVGVIMKICIFDNADPFDSHWIQKVDQNGYPIEILDLTNEAIIQFQTSLLKQKYEKSDQNQHFTFQLQNTDDFYILLGMKNRLDWAQRASYSVNNATVLLQANARELLDKDSLTYHCAYEFLFDTSMDSHLGGFGKIMVNTYLISVVDNASGDVISTYTEVIPMMIEKSLKPVYVKENRELIFYDLDVIQPAMIINSAALPTDDSYLRPATRSDF